MADNTVQTGADTIATDDIAGIKHQRVKVQYGADGSATDVSSTTPLPVTATVTTPGLAAIGIRAGVTGYGAARVSPEGTNVFSDAFNGTSFDTNQWVTSGTVLPTVATGAAQVRPGATTASASSAISSVPAFPWPGVNFNGLAFTGRFENIDSVAGTPGFTNAHRFYGVGSIPATWVAAYTASATSGPLLNAVGFESDVDGLMYPVVYDNGVRVRPALINGNANLNVGRTLYNGQTHQFVVVMRADVIIWYVDGTDVPVAVYSYATAGFSQPDLAALPVRFHQINAAAATSGVTENRIGAAGIGDTGRNAAAIADGTYAFRKAQVSAGGALAVNVASAGRVNVTATFTSTAAAIADTLLTLALNKGGTATSVNTIPVTAGKTLRITGVILSLRTTTAALPFGLATLRVNYAGAAVLASPAVALVGVSGSAAVIGNTGVVPLSPDGGFVDLTGTAQVGLSFSNNAATNVTNITVVGYEF